MSLGSTSMEIVRPMERSVDKISFEYFRTEELIAILAY